MKKPTVIIGKKQILLSALTLLLEFPVRRLIFGRRLNAPVMKTAPVVFKRA